MNLDITLLLFIWKNRQKCKFFTVQLNKVSRSGNQRECSIYIQKNQQHLDITQMVSEVSGLKYRNGSVVITGSNMDMIFALLNRFLDRLATLLYEMKKIRKVERGFRCKSSNYYVLL